MSVTAEAKLVTLNRLIAEAEERCVEQTMLIEALVVKEEHVGQAMDDLEEIEDQRAQLRAERKAMMPGASAS